MRILCVGAGLMGSHIGIEYALAGNEVAFLVRNEGRVRTRINEAMAMVLRHDLASLEQTNQASKRISLVTSMEDAQTDTDLVVESIPEDFDLKVSVLAPLAASMLQAVIASNTSSLGIGELGESIAAADRTIGTHYLNPPLLTSIVEVIPSRQTSESVIEFMVENLKEAGKQSMIVAEEVPGFIWNRLQFALLREAVWLVEHRVADPETVDNVVRLGLAPRWNTVPPFKSAALGGVDTFVRVAANILPTLSDALELGRLPDIASISNDEASELVHQRDANLAAQRRVALGQTDLENGVSGGK